jgi:hypothetical protein
MLAAYCGYGKTQKDHADKRKKFHIKFLAKLLPCSSIKKCREDEVHNTMQVQTMNKVIEDVLLSALRTEARLDRRVTILAKRHITAC